MTKAVAAGFIFAAFCGWLMGTLGVSGRWTALTAFLITWAVFAAGRKKNVTD